MTQIDYLFFELYYFELYYGPYEWLEEYQVEKFTDETYDAAMSWFRGKLGKHGDFDVDHIICTRAIRFTNGKKLAEGDNVVIDEGIIGNVWLIQDKDFIHVSIA